MPSEMKKENKKRAAVVAIAMALCLLMLHPMLPTIITNNDTTTARVRVVATPARRNDSATVHVPEMHVPVTEDEDRLEKRTTTTLPVGAGVEDAVGDPVGAGDEEEVGGNPLRTGVDEEVGPIVGDAVGAAVGFSVGNPVGESSEYFSVLPEPRRQEQPKLIGRWNERFQYGGGFLFFKHIRKAAGTTMKSYLNKVLQYHRQRNQQQTQQQHNQTSWSTSSSSLSSWPVHMCHQEFPSMDWQCPMKDLRWNQTLSLIVLRNPMERHVSEFFYSGPGRGQGHQLADLYKAKNFTSEFYRLLEKQMQPWMKRGMRDLQSLGLQFRHFSDEFQVRALAGETDETPVCGGLEESKYGPEEGLCKGPCDYGGPWPVMPAGRMEFVLWKYPGVPANYNVTASAVDRSVKVLKSFDLVFLTETMTDPEQLALLADVLAVPESVASLSSSTKNVREQSRGSRTALLDRAKLEIPQTYELLRSHSKFEMELYEHAIRINHDMLEQWRMEKTENQ